MRRIKVPKLLTEKELDELPNKVVRGEALFSELVDAVYWQAFSDYRHYGDEHAHDVATLTCMQLPEFMQAYCGVKTL
jgi:hypothetical protein